MHSGRKNRLLSNFAGRHIAPIFGADKSSRGSDGARALFTIIGSQPRAAQGCLGRHVYIFHNDLDDLMGVVLKRLRV